MLMNSAVPLTLLLTTGAAAKPGLASLLRHNEVPGEPEFADGAVVAMTTAAAAARTFDAVSWLMRSAEGFCGLTEEAESTAVTCSQASQGQWPLTKPGANAKHGRDWLSATQRCQKLCAQCARCRYISVSVRHGDCSWFESCDAPAGQENALDVDQMFGSPALLRAHAARPPTTRACSAQEQPGSTPQAQPHPCPAQLKWLSANTDALPRDTAGTLPGVRNENGNVRGSEKGVVPQSSEVAVTAISSNSPSVITAVSPGAERDRNGPAPARQLMWDPAWSKASPEPVQEGRVKSRTPVDLGIEVVHQRLEAATGTQLQ